MFERSLTTEIRIRATAATVWRVLTDTAGWSDWNPTIVRLDVRGGLRPGNRVHVALDFGSPVGVRRVAARVARVEAAHELSWTGGIPFVALAHHWFRIEAPAERGPESGPGPDTVVFCHGESMRGAAVPAIWPLVEPRLRAGYLRMNEALRARCERS